MEWEQAIIEGIQARQQRDGAQWKLGDLACALETAYAGRTLAKYAGEIGVEYSTLQEYQRISAAFEKSRRLDNLSWTHHQAAAAWNNPSQWLNHAVRYKWSVATMKSEQAKAVERATAARAQSATPNEGAPPLTQAGAGSWTNWAKHVRRSPERAFSPERSEGEGEAEGKAVPAPVTNLMADEFVARVSKDFPGEIAHAIQTVVDEYGSPLNLKM